MEQEDGFLVRTFNVTRNDSFTDGGRTVHHCHFQGWPDHGVPDDPAVFLRYMAYVQQLKAAARVTAQPTVLHCSAGIGRTGVFMLAELGVALLQRNEVRGRCCGCRPRLCCPCACVTGHAHPLNHTHMCTHVAVTCTCGCFCA